MHPVRILTCLTAFWICIGWPLALPAVQESQPDAPPSLPAKFESMFPTVQGNWLEVSGEPKSFSPPPVFDLPAPQPSAGGAQVAESNAAVQPAARDGTIKQATFLAGDSTPAIDDEIADAQKNANFASLLKKKYESRFVEPTPLELVQSLLAHVVERKESLKTSTEESAKTQLDALTHCEERLNKAVFNKGLIEKLIVETKAAPEETRIAEKTLAQTLPGLTVPVLDETGIAGLEAKVEQLRVKLEEDKLRLQKAEVQIKERNTRISNLGDSRSKSKERLETGLQQLASLNFDPAGTYSTDTLTQLSIVVLASVNLETYQTESDRDSAVVKLYPLRRDIEKRTVLRSEEEFAALQKQVADYKQLEKERVAERARLEAAQADPRVRELAVRNADLAERSSEMSRKIESTRTQLKAVGDELTTLHDSFENLKNKVKVAGTTQTVGMLLRKFRRHLPSVAENYRIVKTVESELPTLQLALIEIEEEKELLAPRRVMLETSSASLDDGALLSGTSLPTEDGKLQITPELKQMALESLETKSKLLTQLVEDYEKHIELLSELELQARKLIEQTNQSRFFIDKHVLWIRSAQPLSVADANKSLQGIQSIMEIKQWSELTQRVQDAFEKHPTKAILGILVFIALLAFRGRLLTRLRKINADDHLSHITPLVRSLLLSLLLASIYPSVMLLAGVLLHSPYDNSSLKGAASQALLMIGPQVLIASFLARVSSPSGLAANRLEWNPQVTATLRKLVSALMLTCLPLIFVNQLMELYDEGTWADSLGRIAFIGAMLTLGFAALRAFRSMVRFLKNSERNRLQKILLQWRWAALLLLVGTPLVLAMFAALGYGYSAVQLGTRLMWTFCLSLLILFGYSLLTRIAIIAQEAIAARIRRRKYFERKKKDSNIPAEKDDYEAEIAKVGSQIQRLLRVSALAVALLIGWQLWSEVLPAMQILDKVELWKTTTYVTETMTENGKATETLVPKRIDITLNHALICCTILLMTFAVSRNLPGLLEITFLNRLPIDRGGKYAISIVLRYLVAVAGIVLAFRVIGFSWTSVQWLVAAMSVGLGFGLQEIFANFVSGLIILLERPVRVGDMVTVNGVTGTVTRIQLRATTITDFDRRELVVPNKKFITDDVINWTLTDSITRLIVRVGIAYGSNTELAEQALMQVARENRLILKNPEPTVLFASFGSSSLDFELRVFIPNRDVYFEVQHKLHMAVDQAFRELNIEIAFPQQDLHIRSLDPSLLISASSLEQVLDVDEEQRKSA